VHKLHLNKLKF